MGEVWRATDTRLGRVVALKCIHAELQSKPRTRARFWNEARALATLDDPAFARIHELGETDDGRLFIAMELIDGAPLSAVASSGLSPADAIAGIAALAEALGRAHERGIIHRDIKPSNILREPSGRLRLVDFGLVRYLGDEDPGLSVDGAVVGTLQWMAPEQIAGEALSPATDVFQLGLVLATLLTGRHPFARDSAEATAAAILTCTEATVGERLPPELQRLLRDCLARRPTDRPADGGALADALRALPPIYFQAHTDPTPRVLDAAATGTDHRRAGRSAPRAPRSRGGRLAVAALAASGLAAAWLVAGSSTHVDEDAGTRVAPTRDNGEALRGAVARWPRPRVAIGTVRGGAGDGTMALGLTEAMRRDLGRDTDCLALLPASATLALGTRDALAPGADAAAQLLVEPWLGDDHRRVVLSTRDAAGAWAEVVVEAPRPPEASPEDDAAGLAALVREALRLDPRPAPSDTRVTSIDADVARAERALYDFHTRTFADRVRRLRELAPNDARTALLDGQRAFGLGRHDEAQRRFEEVIAKAGDDARLASEASYRLASLPGAAPGAHAARVDAHLERFPGDLQAHLEQLNILFRTPVSHLGEAREKARQILARWPDTPFAASRLVRSLAWQGAHVAAGVVVEALEGRVGAPSMALLTGEYLVHAGRYDEAAGWLERAVEEDGKPGYYATHLRLGALILDGRCREAATAARAELDEAATMPDRHEPTWTHIFWVNALICDGREDDAEEAVEGWEERFPASDAADYAADLRWRVRRAVGPMDATTLKALEADALAGRDVAIWLYMLESDDAGRLDAVADAIEAAEAARAPTHRFEANRLSVTAEACRARAKVLRGEITSGLAALEALTEPEIFREGDLHRRIDILRVFARSLDDAGYEDAGAEVWQQILDASWARVQRLDATVEAWRRLCLVGPER